MTFEPVHFDDHVREVRHEGLRRIGDGWAPHGRGAVIDLERAVGGKKSRDARGILTAPGGRVANSACLEDVVGDFRATIAGLLEFLGLPWTEDAMNYAETALRRNIRTPSASQVVKPIFRSSRGRWRHYAGQLQPVMPVLDRWVRVFGYESN